MRLITFAIFALFVAGCGSGLVQVVDAQGTPLSGVQVTPTSLSMFGATSTTNANGEASVPLHVGGQDTKWINVSKAGLQSQQVNMPTRWPLKIVLQPATQP
jgi:hypothetical protein